MEAASGFSIVREETLFCAESGTVCLAAAIDGDGAMLLVQQFVVHHKVDDAGCDFVVIERDRDHQQISPRLIMPELSHSQCAIPDEIRFFHTTVKILEIHTIETLVEVVSASF